MIMTKKQARAAAVFLLLAPWIGCPHPALGDWPTYRGDNRRSGIAAEALKLPLKEVWTHRSLEAPRPAWPDLPASDDIWHRFHALKPPVTYDHAFQIVVAGESVYYGSSADDTFYCLDAATGKTRWSFSTEGPVRLAPVVADGRVYAGSDDGRVYCLDAENGRLLWKHQAGPEDRRLPGNGRIISLWPIRCGIALADDVVYFCAGLFPSQGAYLCAVAAKDGKEVWKQKVDISPQGYLVASPSRLFVPTGRTAPQVYERGTGKHVAALPGAGGCFAVLADNLFAHSGGEKGGIHLSDAVSTEKIISTSGIRMVADATTAYILSQDRLSAVDRGRFVELGRLQSRKDKTEEDKRRIAELGGSQKACLKWEVPTATSYELILSGDALFAGQEDQVIAYSTDKGRYVWGGNVSGKAYGLAVSGGRLFVSTDKGTIHCFDPGLVQGPGPTVAETAQKESPYPVDRWTPRYQQAAETAIKAAGVKKGYCLVLEAGIGRLAYEIANRSEFRVIGLERDAQKVATARRLLRKAGLYGTRIAIHHGQLDKLHYQKRFANLVTSDEAVTTGRWPGKPAEVYRVVRPCGGVAVFVAPPGAANRAAAYESAKGAMPGWKIQKQPDGLLVGTVRRGPLEGAGEWTHFFADSGNSTCSNDTLEMGPMEIQWFGRPGPKKMVDRHQHGVGPLYKNGRLFISGLNYFTAVDSYNGTILWERDVPDSVRIGAFKNSGNMVATDEYLYVVAADRCMALASQTGEEALSFPVPAGPDGTKGDWGYLASVDDILFGSVTKQGACWRKHVLATETLIYRDFMPVVCSDSLFALNRHTGQSLWHYTPSDGVIINTTIAVSGGRVYCVQSANPDSRNVASGAVKLEMLLGKGSNLVALDMRTGKVLWKKPAELQALQHIIYLNHANDTLLVTGSKNAPVGGKLRVRYDLHAFDAPTGNRLWQLTHVPLDDHVLDGGHAEQVKHPAIAGGIIYATPSAYHLRTGKQLPGWSCTRGGHGCGTISTSASCLFIRGDNPRITSLKTGEQVPLTRVTRPGCWINIIAAGRLILMPESSSGCTCNYSVQTSMALTPRD